MIRDAKSSPGILTERFSALALLVFTFAITASSAYCAEVLEGAAGIDIRFEGSKMTITDPGKPEPAKLEGQVEKQQRLAAPTRLERPGKDHSIDDPSGNQQLLKLKGKYDRSPGDQKTSTSTTTLKGDVSMNVPRTPDEVAEYLKRMREILKNYESAAMSDLFQGTSRVNLKNVNIGCVQGETMDMISEIKSITPPAELKSEHYQLAGALSAIRNLVSPDSSLLTNPTGALARIGPAMSYLHSTLSSYHSGVLAVIAHYHLPQSLDPLGSQNQADNQMLQNAYSDLSGQIVKKEAQALSGTGGSPSGSFSGSGYYEPLAGGAGAGANLGDLTRMLGESGFDLSSLSKLLGGSGFSGEHVDTLLDSGRSLNSLQKLMGGQSGLAGPGGSAASRAPQSPYGSAARSADSGITGFGASSPDDGSFADTSSDKLGDDGFTD